MNFWAGDMLGDKQASCLWEVKNASGGKWSRSGHGEGAMELQL